MGEVGILHEDDRVELIHGEIVEMSPIGGRHVQCVSRLTRLLSRFVEYRYLVSVQSPVRLGRRQEPQPDLAVVLDREYGRSLPGPQDVVLLVEVADTSLPHDREVKLPIYARDGIPEVWLVNLVDETFECYTDPSGNGYRRTRRAQRGEYLESVALSGLKVRVDDALG
jgi:Uma2 family endonuclease